MYVLVALDRVSIEPQIVVYHRICGCNSRLVVMYSDVSKRMYHVQRFKMNYMAVSFSESWEGFLWFAVPFCYGM